MPPTWELIHSVRMTHSEMTFVCRAAAQARPPRQQRSSFVQTRNRFAGLRVCAPALAAGSRSGEALFSGRKRNRAKEQQYCRFSLCLFIGCRCAIYSEKALYRSSPNVVRKNPQKLCRGRSCRQRPVSKTAQKGCVFTPGSAGEPVNASDDLKQV